MLGVNRNAVPRVVWTLRDGICWSFDVVEASRSHPRVVQKCSVVVKIGAPGACTPAGRALCHDSPKDTIDTFCRSIRSR